MPDFTTIAIGDELPPLTKTLDRLDLVRYAAGSGDFNPLHYDPDFRQTREIGDNIVLEAGEQRIELRAGDIGDAPAHD